MNDPVIIFTVATIIIVILWAGIALAHQKGEEREQQRNREYEEQRDRYLSWLRSKYASELTHEYRSRRHIDFTGESPLTGDQLELLKREVLKS